MRRQLLFSGLILAAVCLVLSGCAKSLAQQRAEATPTAQHSTYKITGPYTHKNLSIFLIHGTDQAGGKTYLTLQEAMRQKKVIVRETGDVNELTIQNRSAEEVFVQAGDIVKGGQQDRVLALDLILPPKSGRITIDAFCVEQSRWNQRGQEAVAAFSASDKMLATKGLKLAARKSQSQSEVWANVSMAQAKLARNYVAAKDGAGSVAMVAGRGSAEGGGSNSGGGQPVMSFAPPAQAPAERSHNAMRVSPGVLSTLNAGLTVAEQQGLASVTSQASPTSLQLTLENNNVKESAAAYVKQLASIIADKRDVIGYVFAINGQLNSADVYSSNALFKKLWPKLLEASAIEAFAEIEQDGKFEPVTVETAKAFLRDAEDAKAEVKTLRPRTGMVKRETEKIVLFEARDRARGNTWVHRNYLAK
jgi:hypothetical protein